MNLFKVIIFFSILQSCIADKYNDSAIDVLDLNVIQIMRDGTKVDTFKVDTLEDHSSLENNKPYEIR